MSAHFLAECLATPWALQPERLQAYATVLAQRFGGARSAPNAADPQSQASAARNARGGYNQGSIAVIPVYGTVMQRASQLALCDGSTSTQAISQALRQALTDPSIGAVVLDIDSPGGSVYGVAELAAEIRASSKPVTAVANSLAASAAYWLGASAGEFFVTPGGEVGSIGVWMAHEDWSRALEQAGVTTTLISAGKFKVEGNPYGALDEEARAFMQSRVDDYYAAFTRDVARGRKVSVEDVRSGMGQGRVLGAAAAQAQNMVDGVMTFDQVLRRVAKNLQQRAAPRQSLAAARNQLEILG
jgi:signal peptide peptidase SppA